MNSSLGKLSNGSPKSGSKVSDKMVSPGRVRTMKEYEEQMAELKKENFNLKLRIYFMEERQEQMKGVKSVDELLKKNIDLNCEMETLKKDLSDKEELLLQSAKAVEILQHQHKKQVEELKQANAREQAFQQEHIENLRKTIKEKEEMITQFDDSSVMYAAAFGYNKGTEQARELSDLKAELNNVSLKVVQLEEELQDERRRYTDLECELEQAHEECARFKNHISSLETDIEKKEARLQQAYIDIERNSQLLTAFNQKSHQSSKDPRVAELESKVAELEKQLHLKSTELTGRKSSVESATSSRDRRGYYKYK